MDKIKNDQKLCEICGEDATNLCLECNNYFCNSCNKYVHEKKKNKDHRNEVIDPFVPIDTKCPTHPNIPMNLFCINEKELCCSLCQFLKPHIEHKLILISDEESLKKENMTIESSADDCKKNNEKLENLKQKILKEITKINDLFDNTNNKIVQYFEEKHKKLLEEEKNLIENLQNEVTKIKEKLEKNLSECNRIMKINERIIKGIEKMKKDKETENNNMIKKLTYISKINRNQKDINELLNQAMKNTKINFEEDKNNIKYEEYIFNGNLFNLSSILNNENIELIKSWLPNKNILFNLLFDTKRDGDNSSTFHDKCDGKNPTLVLIKSDSGYCFGGYVTSAWLSNNSTIKAPNSFIFSLNQKQKYLASSQDNYVIHGGTRDNQKDSIMFKIGCCDISIRHNCTANNQNGTNCDKFSVPSANILNGGNRYFRVANLEVYEVINE